MQGTHPDNHPYGKATESLATSLKEEDVVRTFEKLTTA